MAGSESGSADGPSAATALAALRRADPLWLAAPLLFIGWAFFSGSISPNPDAYYHVKCAELLLHHGWLDAFPWLPYTTLADFPNAYVALHALIAPLHLFLGPEQVIAVAGAGLAAALVGSAYAVLRLHRVSLPGLWTALLSLGSPLLLSYFSALKGGALFFVLLPWFLHFLLRGSVGGVFGITWLAVYAYVGAFLLPALAGLYAGVRGGVRDPALRRLVVAAGLAFGLGMLLRPAPLAYGRHVLQELLSSYFRPENLVAGQQIGSEWASMGAATWLALVQTPLALWGIFVLAQLRRGALASRDLAALVLCLALLAYSAWSGAKLLHLFALASLVVLPLLVERYRPVSAAALAVLGLLAGANAARLGLHAMENPPPLEPPVVYAGLAGVIAAHSEPEEMVLAPWGAFPGLFFYNDRNRYVAGMNTLFLLHASRERFDAYLRLYAGRAEDPATLLPTHFGDARLVLVRRGMPGSARLSSQLESHPAFREIRTPTAGWLLFRRER